MFNGIQQSTFKTPFGREILFSNKNIYIYTDAPLLQKEAEVKLPFV